MSSELPLWRRVRDIQAHRSEATGRFDSWRTANPDAAEVLRLLRIETRLSYAADTSENLRQVQEAVTRREELGLPSTLAPLVFVGEQVLGGILDTWETPIMPEQRQLIEAVNQGYHFEEALNRRPS